MISLPTVSAEIIIIPLIVGLALILPVLVFVHTIGLRKKVLASLTRSARQVKRSSFILESLREAVKDLPISLVVVNPTTITVDFMSGEAARLVNKPWIFGEAVPLEMVFDVASERDLSRLLEFLKSNDQTGKSINIKLRQPQGEKGSIGIQLLSIEGGCPNQKALIVEAFNSKIDKCQKHELMNTAYDDLLLERDVFKAATKILRRIAVDVDCSPSIAVTFWNLQKNTWSMLAEVNVPREWTGLFAKYGGPAARDGLLNSKTPVHCSNQEIVEGLTADERDTINVSSIQHWSAYPIINLSGNVVGAFEVITTNQSWSEDFRDRIPAAMRVLSVILERYDVHTRMSELLDVERVVRAINRVLVGHHNSNDVLGLTKALDLLETGANLAVNTIQLLVKGLNGSVSHVSTSFDKVDQIHLTFQALEVWVDKNLSGSNDSDLETEEVRFGYFHAEANDRFLEDLPVVDPQLNPKDWSYLVFPLWWIGELEGVLMLRVATTPTQKQLSIIENVLVCITGVVARHRLVAELTEKAHFDQLTGLINRRYMDDIIVNEMERCRRYHNSMTVLLLDIDHFKSINDTFGHDAGDRVLQKVASRVKEAVRAVDSVARWGGEEFIVMLAETDISNACIAAENIRKAVEQSEYGLNRPVTVSIGVSELQHEDSTNTLLKRADVALYCAKKSGRNQVSIQSAS